MIKEYIYIYIYIFKVNNIIKVNKKLNILRSLPRLLFKEKFTKMIKFVTRENIKEHNSTKFLIIETY